MKGYDDDPTDTPADRLKHPLKPTAHFSAGQATNLLVVSMAEALNPACVPASAMPPMSAVWSLDPVYEKPMTDWEARHSLY